MRLSNKEFEILNLLAAHGEMYGLELVKASDGLLRRGTVYVTLQRMADKGFVKSRSVEAESGNQGPPRRIFSATTLGKRVLRAQQTMNRILAEARS